MKNTFILRLFFLLLPVLPLSLLSGQVSKFIVLGDSQFQNPEVFEKKINEVELLRPAFVLHVGDMIHGYTYNPDGAARQWQRFLNQLEPLSMPFYPTPGNHDVTTKEIQPAYVDTWGEDKLYYSFDYENIHVIVLNSYLNQQYDTIPPVEMEWLRQDLEKAKEKDHIFVSVHSPLYFSMKGGWDEVHSILQDYPVKAVFTGHSHRYDYRVIDGIAYFCLVTSGNIRFNNHLAGLSHHVLQVNVDDENISYAVITDEAVYPPDIVDPDELGRSGKYYEPDLSIIIPDPSVSAIDTAISVTITNNSDTVREYTLNWQTADYRWRFSPCGANITVDARSSVDAVFNILCPEGTYQRTELPQLNITAPYTTMLGYETETVQRVSLFFPPEVFAHKTESRITLDGQLNEEEWQEYTGIGNLEIDKEGTPAPDKTSVTLLYDEEYLYVGISGEEPETDGLAAFAYGDIPLVFGDDDFELFFDTNRDMRSFYRLMVNPAGTVLHSGPGGLWSFDYEVRTHTGEGFWSAEFQIPFKELNTLMPEEGTIWGFNVRRHRQQADYIQSDWSKMQTHPPYQPEFFGLLKFL